MKRVLIVDDDVDNRFAIREILRKEFQVTEACSGLQALKLAVEQKPDVILLDLRMPEMDGFAVCESLRRFPETRLIPVIMLTGDFAVDSRIRGLELGADDYVCRPFHSRELIARIRARIRRIDSEHSENEPFSVGNLQVNPIACETYLDGQLVRLTQIEFDLLRYFLERPNRVIPRRRVLGDLWPDAVVTDRTVDTHVAHLRKKLHGFNCPLTTVYKVGYMLKVS